MYLAPHIPEIKELCELHNIERLYAFGSVLTKRFSENSDVDFLYTFKKDLPVLDVVDYYFSFQNHLTKMLNRPVDLTSEKDLKNPYFIKEVNNTKQLIYG
jgi:predicted nucleotidyltransferase